MIMGVPLARDEVEGMFYERGRAIVKPARSACNPSVVMPGLVPGIHAFLTVQQDVDGIGSRACPTSAVFACHKSGKPDLW
jgi:hypothetical protein